MLFYITLFLVFFYFKVARVHKKEEKFTRLVYAQHIMVAISTIALYMDGFGYISWYALAIISFIFFIVSALVVTTIQLGIFIDGKPLIGISKLYKVMPILAFIIALLSFRLWAF